MSDVSAGPPQVQPLTPEQLKTRASAGLYNQVWESSQHLTPAEIRDHIEDILDDIESDEP